MTAEHPARRHGRFYAPITPGAARAFVTLAAITLILAALNFLWTAREVNAATTRARALCQLEAHLSGTPPAVNPATGKPPLLSVQIIADTRIAWRQAGCEGRLPPPNPVFKRWAHFYGLPTG